MNQEKTKIVTGSNTINGNSILLSFGVKYNFDINKKV